jgi:integrase
MNRLTSQERVEVAAWRKANRWHPHQLRHTVATVIRKQFGLDAAKVVLGHRCAAVTEIYTEMDQSKAIEVARQVG